MPKKKSKQKIKNVEKVNFKQIINKYLDKIKSFTPKQILTLILILTIIVLTIYVFMKFTLLITVDGSFYYQYLKYFEGQASFGEWPTIRGFSFPLIIFIITKVFGNSIKGILIGFLLFFLGMSFFAAKIIKNLVKDNELEYRQIVYWVLFVIFFLFNPLIIGYSHTLLTEAVTPFFYLTAAYICLKWNEVDFKNNKKKFIIYSIILILMGVFVWFIKQPYAPAYWGLLFFTAIMSGIYHRKIKYTYQKVPVFILCLVITVLSIVTWNQFLIYNGKATIESKNSSFLSGGLIGFNYHYRNISKKDFCNVDYINSKNIKEKDKNKILDLKQNNEEWCDYLVIYEVYDLNLNHIETEVLITENKSVSLKENIGFYTKSLLKHPILVMHSYYENYLVLLNLEKAEKFVPTGEIEANILGENQRIGYVVLQEDLLNCWWLWDYKEPLPEDMVNLTIGMNQFEGTTNTGSKVSVIMQFLEKGSDLTYTLFLYFSFPICIYGFIMSIIKKKNSSYFMITVLSGAAFIGIFFHVAMDALIDRYCYPVYPLMLLCIIILCMDKSKKYSLKEK